MATLQMKIDSVHAEFLAGNAVSTTVTNNSVVSRDSNGGIWATKLTSLNLGLTHGIPTTDRTGDTVFYSSVDDVIRKNTAAGMRASLSFENSAMIPATSTATADKIVLRDSNGDIFASNVNVSKNFKINGTALANSATIEADTANTVSELVQRDSQGDIYFRYAHSSYLNMSHSASARNTDTVFYSSNDNYIRKNTAAGFRKALDVPTRSGGNASGSWGIDITGNAATASSCSGNAATATNADKVDNIHASSFLRSDADDTVNAGVTYTWSATNTAGLEFVNASYPAYSLEIGGWTNSNSNNISRIRNSSGNLHIDCAANGQLYLNHYSGGTCYITTNTVNSGTLESDGRIYADNGCHVRGDWLRVNGNNGIYFESHGGGWNMTDSTWVRLYNSKSLWCGSGIMGTGYRCGVGTSSPSERLHVYDSGTVRMMVERTGSSGDVGVSIKGYHPSSGTSEWRIYQQGQAYPGLRFWRGFDQGYLQWSGSNYVLNFTGQHRTFIKDIPFTKAPDLEGLIVSADQNKYIKMSGGIEAGSNAITTNESLPVVSLSNVATDKKCFGVISASEDPDTREDAHGNFVSVFQKELGDTRVYINSVGEGAIWVTNINGSLESGDYITTSNVAGYGMLQDDDILHNYTVAKITMDCDFEPVTQPIQQIVKELSNVNYWINTIYSNVALEDYSNLAEENRRTVTTAQYSNGEDNISLYEYLKLESNVQTTYSEIETTTYQKIECEESTTKKEDWTLEVREELVNVLDEHGQLKWEDHPTETEKAYKIRYLTADGQVTDEANAIHIAAFVGCTYHCG